MLSRSGMGGFADWVLYVVAATAVSTSCARTRDRVSACNEQLAQKHDAVATCTDAYAANPNSETARLMVSAYSVRGDGAVAALLAMNPVGIVGAEIWHMRAVKDIVSGHAESSIAGLERALALRGADLAGQVRDLETLAARYEVIGDERRALTFEARAVEAASRLADPIVTTHTQVTLATDLLLVGDDEGAMRVLGDAIEKLPADDPYLPTALIMEGEYQRTHGHPLVARQAFTRAETLSDKDAARDAHRNLIDVALTLGDNEGAAKLVGTDLVMTGLGHDWYASRVALAQGRFEEAQQLVDRALAKKPPPLLVPTLETLRGQILAKLGKERDAVNEFTKAMDTVEGQLDDLGIDELKAFSERDVDHRAPYEQLFALYARSNRPREAFGVAQRAMGRAYLDGLTAPSTPNRDFVVLAREAGVRAETLRVVVKSLRVSAPAHSPDPDSLTKQLVTEVVWTYFVADGNLWLISLVHGVASVDDLGSYDEIRPSIENAASLGEPALETLGKVLAPAIRWSGIAPSSVIHLVPGPLERVPFAALALDGRRWIERATFSYVPSAAVLAELSRKRPTDGSVIVIGDPFGDLPGARNEASETSARFHVTPRLGAHATLASLVGAAHADVLAVATHARPSPGNVQLQLADGVITAADIVDRRIAPALVVLASCESAAVNSDAWGALAGAFLAAGTPNVVASRWSLDDALARDLVDQFYRAGGVEHPALALALAQRYAIAKKLPVSAWAALVSLGTGEGTNEKERMHER